MIDILLSTYNGAAYLSQQLDSIAAQTLDTWRLIIRDDGSTDDTPSIIEAFRLRFPERVRVLPCDGNIGCLRSFERLLEEAEADYICFADQDDIWLPHKLENSLKVAISTEKTLPTDTPVVVCSDLQVVDENLQPIADSFWRYIRLRPDLLQTPQRLATCNYCTGCTMLFNQAARKAALPFSPRTFMHDAVVALAALAHGGKIAVCPEKDILYRQHSHNTVGAVPVSSGWKYMVGKLRTWREVMHRNQVNYRQAHAVMGISRSRFIVNRINYLLHR